MYMNFDMVKGISVEYCEGVYALGINQLKDNDNVELKELLDRLSLLEDDIRKCNDVNILFNHKRVLEQIANRIEVIINAQQVSFFN